MTPFKGRGWLRPRSPERVSPEVFQRRFLSLMQLMIRFLQERSRVKDQVRLLDINLLKYSATDMNPLKPLTPISSLDEILPDEILHIEVTVEQRKRMLLFGGNFRIDEYGRLVSEGYDDQEIDIYPDDVDKDQITLKREVLEFLQEHKKEIWNLVVLSANLVLEILRRHWPPIKPS